MTMKKLDDHTKTDGLPAARRGAPHPGKRNEPTQVAASPKSQRVRYTTHLTPDSIKAIKVYALEHDTKDYQVVQQAVDSFVRNGKPEK
jgi:hypothetical protein